MMRRTLSSALLALMVGCRTDAAYIGEGPANGGGAESGAGGEGGESNRAGTGNRAGDTVTGGGGTSGSSGSSGSGGDERGGGAGEVSGGSGGDGSGGSAGIGDGGVPTGGSSGSAGSSGSGGMSETPCPSTAPDVGDSCSVRFQRCVYERPGEPCPEACAGECGETYRCARGGTEEGGDALGWVIGEPRVPGCGPPDPDCPEDIPENYMLCPREGLQCRFERVLCQCTPCTEPSMPPDDPATWFCTEPAAECPGVQPELGTTCDESAQDRCFYGACFDCGPFGFAPGVLCADGVWEDGHGDCQP